MVIRISSARNIDRLLEDLTAGSAVAREAAIARLILVGGRAVDRLTRLAASTETPTAARLGALRALEGIGDVRALDSALQATSDADDSVAAAAINVARRHLAGAQGIAALDRLIAIALDSARHDEVRTTALRALRELEPATLQPVLDALANDPRQQVRDAVRHAGAGAAASHHGEATDWLEHPESSPLPDEPETVRRYVSIGGDSLSLAALHRLVETIHQREAATEGQQRREWMGTRATIHVALARRGSRLGIYDLREALESASDPLPVEFLAAVTMIGDASCLEPLAAAYVKTGRADATGSDWWRRHLSDAFQAIVAREGMTRRHALARKIEKRWPGRIQEFWPARGPRSVRGQSQ
jgi:HEAT repeat protein